MKTGLCLLGIVLFGISTACAWDPIGHMIVDQAAYNQLTPLARMRVDEMIATFNRKNHTDYTFVSAGCWMDDIRGKTKEYNTWHYINLPYTPTGEPFPAASEQNVLWAIQLCVDILKGKKTYSGIDRPQALVMLLHLAGDLHQPLHTANHNEDAGGNKVVVPNIEDAVVAAFPNRKNLHYFWDTAYRRTFAEGKATELYPEPPYLVGNPVEGHNAALPLVKEQTKTLAQKYDAAKFPATGTPADWVKESHAAGYTTGYQQLPGGEDANPATLDQTYIDNARTLAEQRLVQAGHRLAGLLNEIYH